MTYFYLLLISYGVTFIGGFMLMTVEERCNPWTDCLIYGVISSLIFGTALFIALVLLHTTS